MIVGALDAAKLVSRWYGRAVARPGYDTLARLPAVAYFGALLSLQIAALSQAGAWQGEGTEALGASAILARLAVIALMVTMALLTIFRHRPVARASGLMPRITALLGSLFFFSIVLLPRAQPDPACDMASLALIVLGNVLTLIVVGRLGRSFSTMAEARNLVISGPYRYVRHPLYAAEQIAVLGMFLQYRSLAALAIVLVHLALQIARMRNEEAVLAHAFPEYASYCARTARIVPGVY